MTGPTAITIGNFDGVHVGHAALVRRCREFAGGGGRVVVLAFDPHPQTKLRPATAPPRIMPFERRAALLKGLGADEVVKLEPTDAILSLSPEEFVRRKVDLYAPRAIVEGADFRFGKGRAGDVRTLAELGRAHGFEAIVVTPVDVSLSDHHVVTASSTITRWLLAHGRVGDAARVLGRPHEVSGVVVQGDRRGRTIGFPTANVKSDDLLPGDGVYAALAEAPGVGEFPAAVNIGTRPTFHGIERRVEAHFLLGDGTPGEWRTLPGAQEYGWSVRLRMLSWLRDQVRFDSAPRLVEQLSRDCGRAFERARDFLGSGGDDVCVPLPRHAVEGRVGSVGASGASA